MVYRKEIDGLRALAVIPVILFHAGFEWVSGGYVGVDVFFVISGYLITSIILNEKDAGTFTITGFYERRARRILPALFFVMLACLPFAWLWLLPIELKDFGQSLMAVSVFASNILFWQKSDYFAADAETLPLLHTWSLAVEEQFYVLFPLFMILFWVLGKRWLAGLIVIIAVSSLGLAEWAWRHDASANFYLTPTRAWELMIGALVAFYLHQNPQPTGKTAELAGALGFSLIIYAILFFDKSIPFPGLYALAPTVGAALIILCTTSNTFIGKVLSLRVFVLIGLISYSAYLWHKPLFVFARLGSYGEAEWWWFALLSILTLILAYISWRYVEKPFRDKQRFTRKQIFTFSLLASTLFIALGLALMLSEGAAYRFL